MQWKCPKCGLVARNLAGDTGSVFCSCGYLDHAPNFAQDERRRRNAAAPTLHGKIVRYSRSLRRWNDAGRPVRGDGEVESLFYSCCVPCEKFDAAKRACGVCGCSVLPPEGEAATVVSRLASVIGLDRVSRGMVNKLRMATEHCPIHRW